MSLSAYILSCIWAVILGFTIAAQTSLGYGAIATAALMFILNIADGFLENKK